MAFQTNVFRDGAWVTETVDLRTVLKGQNAEQREFTRLDPLEPPCCGILTRTVAESSRAHQILPVRLRSPNHNDIAFIGDNFIQICELRNGRLRNVVRKNDFGSRIRGACVIGSPAIPEFNDDAMPSSSSFDPIIKTEDIQEPPIRFSQTRTPPSATPLPPQMLLVALESGEIAFLFLKPGPDGRPVFVIASRTSTPDHLRLGFNLAVDPSSRYVVLAGPMDCFCVYELASYASMNEKYLNGERIRPIRSVRLLNARGVVHKITFLYPRPGDDQHIILLIVLVKGGKSKTVIYEWELGDNLADVFSTERRSHRMPDEFRMPLLIIPLRVQSAFVAITEDKMAVCTECLHGPPRFQPVFLNPAPPQTDRRRGRHKQSLWTAWARPFRLHGYGKTHDCIYLAREDGLVAFLEADEDSNLSRSTFLHPFPCNISTAFACAYDQSTDVLFLASESGPGGYWRIPPRQPTEFLGSLPFVTTGVDFAITDGSPSSARQKDARPDDPAALWQRMSREEANPGDFAALVPTPRAPNPGRIIVGGPGDGTSGAVVEYRYGVRANIGLDLDFGPGMKEAWLLEVHEPGYKGYLLLISLPETTTALMVPHDFSSADVVAPDHIPFDLESPTLALVQGAGLTLQVTRRMVVLAGEQRTTSYLWDSFEDLHGKMVLDACALSDCIAVSAHMGDQFWVYVFEIDREQLTVQKARGCHVNSAFNAESEVTCVALWADYALLYGVRQRSGCPVSCHVDQLRDDTGMKWPMVIDLEDDGKPLSDIESLESIVVVAGVAIAGTRSGEVLILAQGDYGTPRPFQRDKLGTGPVKLRCSSDHPGAALPTVYATCDGALFSIQLTKWYQFNDVYRLGAIHRVWPVDASRPEDVSPPVHFATPVNVATENDATSLLMISGSRLLLAELDEEPGLVPRTGTVSSAVSRVLYCQYLQCLVVGMSGGPNGTALSFIRPSTGKEIGQPVDKTKKPQSNITGLGVQDDRILGLAEWNCRMDGKSWNFVLVTTQGGRLVVVSVEKTSGAQEREYRYWTQFRKQVSGPIYSVLGYDEGIVYCVGSEIYWDALELAEKRLKTVKTVVFDSPAVGLRLARPSTVVDATTTTSNPGPDDTNNNNPTSAGASASTTKLLALTSRDSLIALDHISSSTTTAPATTTTSSPSPGIRHIDPWKRNGVDFVELPIPSSSSIRYGGGRSNSSGGSNDSIILLSTREGSVLGIWIPWHSPDRDCEILFEAELPCSVRRFRVGRTRTAWQRRRGEAGWQLTFGPAPSNTNNSSKHKQPLFGRIPIPPLPGGAAQGHGHGYEGQEGEEEEQEDAQVLGISLDGSLREFVLLTAPAWKLLRYIQNLALHDRTVCPFRPTTTTTTSITTSSSAGLRELESTISRPTAAAAAATAADTMEEAISAFSSGGVGGIADPEPRLDRCLEMHVDGDILKRVLDGRLLERVVGRERERRRFAEMLRELDGAGVYTSRLGPVEEEGYGGYFALGYRVLEYFLGLPGF